jgi:hypothetical protein
VRTRELLRPRSLKLVLCAFAVAFLTSGCDIVFGNAVILSQFRGVSVQASSDDDNRVPLGTAGAGVRSTYSVSGPITCMAVAGNRATIGFENDGSGFGGGPGHFIYVEDNGSPGAGRDLVNDVPSSEVPRSCEPPTDEQLVPFPFIDVRPQPIESGDIKVTDNAVAGTSTP